MRAKFAAVVHDAKESLWLIPALFVFGAVVLSTVLLVLDAELADSAGDVTWIFGGKAEGAREILSVTAGSLITVISVAFSVTVIALQLAATQYTPRLLRTFMGDRGNQVVLGTYMATFTYSLLVLREVRESGDGQDEFVPSLAITMAIVLALISLALLIYFIHHLAQSLQVSWVLSSIRVEVDRQLERLFPERFGDDSHDWEADEIDDATATLRRGIVTEVVAEKEGYLRTIQANTLEGALGDRTCFAAIPIGIGTYVAKGDVLVRVFGDDALDEDVESRLRQAFVIGRVRSIQDDIGFGIEQMVEIGVKALSPSMNDPTTATQALTKLGTVVRYLAERDFPNPLRRLGDRGYVLFARPTFADFADAAFDEIRRAGSSNVRVLRHLLTVLSGIAEHLPHKARALPIRTQADEVERSIRKHDLSERDRGLLEDELARLRAILAGRPTEDRPGFARAFRPGTPSA